MPQKKVNYKTLSRELDEILAQLQDPDTDIDEALKLYQKGQQVAKELEQYLKTAENTIKKLAPKSAG